MTSSPPRTVKMRFQLAAFTLTRTVFNTSFRMIYPFLPVFARGLGVDISRMALAVTARSSAGVASPFLGSIADLRGRKWTMLAALWLFAIGMALIAIWPTFIVLVVGVVLSTIAKILFDPAMQAYLGDRVHYARRGLVIAVTEFGWSGAFLIGVPIVGWLIQGKGWIAPFPWLAGLGLGAGALLWVVLPADQPAGGQSMAWLSGFRSIIRNRPAIAGLTFGALASLANEVINIIFGVWLEQAFGLQVVALGAASAIIGLAEFGGEGLVAGFSDRLGKRRAVAWGISMNVLACLAMPLLGKSLPSALAGLFFFYITFEFTLVSVIPLMTELAPEARGVLMGSNVGSQAAGRAIGALVGPALFANGLLSNSIAAAGFDLLALAVLVRYVRE
jgi:predicted MFS family arabinose efflux permease